MKEILWNSDEAEIATRGKAQGNWEALGVSIDSRTVEEGDLFIALKGENFDGHDFVKSALKKGAVAAMVSKNIGKNLPLLIVPDVAEGLWNLGAASRKKTRAKIIGVTGSVGKTGTKEMLKLALAAFGETYATAGNLNNHFGAPLSLARMPKTAKYGVFELGMNHAGEIARLTNLIKPDIAVITTIEAVHLEFFADVSAIADAKSEVFLGMTNGVAVLNVDNASFQRLKKHAEKRDLKIETFGVAAAADFRLITYENIAGRIHVEASAKGKKFAYDLQAPGKHSALNSLGVLAVVNALAKDFHACLKNLSEYSPAKGRGQVFKITAKGGKALLIDDSYNASPASMRAAFEVLMARKSPDGRAIALLGDMRELGKNSPSLHSALAEDIVARGVDLVFTCGELMANLYEALPKQKRGGHYADSVKMAEKITAEIRSRDTILVKGSNGMKMIKVVEKLKNAL